MRLSGGRQQPRCARLRYPLSPCQIMPRDGTRVRTLARPSPLRTRLPPLSAAKNHDAKAIQVEIRPAGAIESSTRWPGRGAESPD